ncbi:MAG: ABC transporter permease [Hyphomicrobiales bacterium]
MAHVDSATTLDTAGIAQHRPKSPQPLLIRVFLQLAREKHLGFWGGLVPIVVVILLAVLAPVIAQYDPNHQDGNVLLQSPSFSHWFGTDEYGRDVFARVVHGARVSLTVGFLSVLIGVSIATVIGIVSGGFGGWVDLILQRVVDVLMAFPSFVLILLIAAVLGPGERNTIIAIAIFLIAGPSRVVRGQVLTVKQNMYIEAARSMGCSYPRILLRHILPNVFDVIVVIVSINIAFAIITEAALSFIGLGIPPPNPDWGGMVSGQETAYLVKAPWIIASAGGFLAVTVFAFNMLGDALRDILDPRLRQL